MAKECGQNATEGCGNNSWEDYIKKLESEDWIEEEVYNGLRYWHVISLGILGGLSLIILICCCVKFRIPRTKQEIEGDYVRRKILRKFRKRLKAIHNQELDDMDLKAALDKIRAEFKTDTESLEHSEGAFSLGTIGSSPNDRNSTYRRASQINIDISLEDLRLQTMGLRERLMLSLSRLFGRPRIRSSEKTTPAQMEAGQQLQIANPNASTKNSNNAKKSVQVSPTCKKTKDDNGGGAEKKGEEGKGKKKSDDKKKEGSEPKSGSKTKEDVKDDKKEKGESKKKAKVVEDAKKKGDEKDSKNKKEKPKKDTV